MRRQRKCGECGKPLGGTVGLCYGCGGDPPTVTREDRLADAVWWKLWLGVDPQLIEEAHDTN